ncbi:hypothetical protein HPB50_018410 [Hyalomma asiaticum]|uniref:Uncharacterized protein n=1 Tax=Hyalomma asiaticum TaxID=266040 RepID=A0ACB7TAX6_HYAAI|nr:hypothetical protein HPB50_018410 [Hyalomma asiaticum]
MYCRDSFVGNKATAYGIMNEPVALEEYEATHQAKVSRLGLVISPEVPWLGYSPDGISRQRNMKILLEVKCPVLGKNHSIVNLVKEKKLPYIVLDGEKYVLKPAHKYYSQVQLGMLVLNMDICHFVVFSKESSEDLLRQEQHDYCTVGRSTFDCSSLLAACFCQPPCFSTVRPPAPERRFVTRKAREDFEYNGIKFQAGTAFMISQYHLQRDPQYWPNPEEFDPERFSPENSASLRKTAHAPFGIGPRNCVGKRLALLSLRYTVARMLQKYRLELGPSQMVSATDDTKSSWLRVE